MSSGASISKVSPYMPLLVLAAEFYGVLHTFEYFSGRGRHISLHRVYEQTGWLVIGYANKAAPFSGFIEFSFQVKPFPALRNRHFDIAPTFWLG